MRLFRVVKNFTSTDLIELFFSILVSAILEIFRTVFSVINSSAKRINLDDIFKSFNIFVWDSVGTIILLTVIIWGVTGLTKMMEESNRGKRKKIHTFFMLLLFIMCIIWYIIKMFLVVDVKMIVVTIILSVTLLVFVIKLLH